MPRRDMSQNVPMRMVDPADREDRTKALSGLLELILQFREREDAPWDVFATSYAKYAAEASSGPREDKLRAKIEAVLGEANG